MRTKKYMNNQVHYAFLTKLIPNSFIDEYQKKSKHSTMPAADSALEQHIYKGLRENLDQRISVFNIMQVFNYPQCYKDAFIRESFFNIGDDNGLLNVGFCNIIGIKNLSIARNVFKKLDEWCENNKGDKVVFVYSLMTPFMVALSKLKRLHNDLKVCAIVADLPNMSNLSNNISFAQKMWSNYLSRKTYALQHCIDYYVLLTKQMAEYMNIQKPFCVMEGIATEFPKVQSLSNAALSKKIIFYAGTLHEKFGVRNLVDAFELIQDKDFQLIICGVGDSEGYIKTASKKDRRIVFLGRQPRKKVLELIKSASVLVNPRQNNEEFTKYSFPSKNLEYLSSGIPFVAYKLDGIPDEYNEYINYVEDNSIETLKNKIENVLLDEFDSYKRKAKNGVDFVLKNKSAISQVKKIVDMCSNNG